MREASPPQELSSQVQGICTEKNGMCERQSQQTAEREISFCHQSTLTLGISEIVVMVKEKTSEEKMNLLERREVA